jgi:[acyl-carrier-protein] S-malonyltransferase
MTPMPQLGRGSVFLFPGQGSQHPGMGRDLRVCRPSARSLVVQAGDRVGAPISEWLWRADAATLADPEVAQLTIFTMSIVFLEELRQAGRIPVAAAGHSLGEYSAMVASGCLDWQNALDLVAVRGRSMASAARAQPGAMGAIIGLPIDVVAELCAERTEPERLVLVANVNSARQAVISGTPDSVEAVLDQARSRGALRARTLPVGGAYHTRLMASAEKELAPLIAAAPLRTPRVPMISSINGRPVTDAEMYRRLLITQITHPVRWLDTLLTLQRLGAADFVEVGPGRVLSGLVRESDRSATQRHVMSALTHAARPSPAMRTRTPTHPEA